MKPALAALLLLTTGCATLAPPDRAAPADPVSLAFESPAQGDARLRFSTTAPVTALHFAPALGSYRSEGWTIVDPGFRWVVEEGGERLERSDGKPFAAVGLTLAQRYRSLPKSYAPFSPFSDGGLLVYTGQYHACTVLPCSGEGPLAMRIAAPGRIIRTIDDAADDTLAYLSSGEGTNLYIGTRQPETANGMSAIIDPGLPERLRDDLARSLPVAMAAYTRDYGPLSFRPQLYVSIDSRGLGDGHESTQGGTLPHQIFMHFDGARARERAAQGEPGWLDWFFAHEVAHMFQRDRTGNMLGDDIFAWIHEGGADAMAALVLRSRGQDAYVAERTAGAARTCRDGLAKGPLTTATARGDFDLHYACGLIAALAVDGALAPSGHGLADFNRRFFAAVSAADDLGPESWRTLWFKAARASGVADPVLAQLADLTGADAVRALAALPQLSSVVGKTP